MSYLQPKRDGNELDKDVDKTNEDGSDNEGNEEDWGSQPDRRPRLVDFVASGNTSPVFVRIGHASIIS